MNDAIEPGEPLEQVVTVLKRGVPIADGLAARMARRVRRRRTTRIAGGGLVAILAGTSAAVLLLGTAGTSVTFALDAPAVRSVALVGDFDDWRSDRMELARDPSGEWRATVKLRPGRYRFAYVVDRAEWRADAHAASAPDDFGRPTSVLTVAGK